MTSEQDKLDAKLDRLLERSQEQGELLAAVKATLDTATVKRPELYAHMDKLQSRINTIIGGLSGLLTVAGSVIAYLLL